MKLPLPRNEIKKALGSLKDFQRDTAEYVFRRLYTAPEPCRRILVSDEVGLGKTLVAKGVIARALEHLWNKVERIDIVYICSNAAIARQNINRLEILHGDDYGFRSATRLTMLANEIATLGKLNFVALTPSTSFDLGTSLGTARERALLYWLLKEDWKFGNSAAPYNVLCGNASRDGFKALVARSRPDPEKHEHLSKEFATAIGQRGHLADTFNTLCSAFGRADARVDKAVRMQRSEFVGTLRRYLAKVCINDLSPDIIILDEFQRFKDLLGTESEASELAGHLFDYQDEHSDAKVILLSATPYKMLTMHAGDGEEDHYRDFLRTLAFLVPDKSRYAEYRECVDRFRRELLRLRSGGSVEQVADAKRRLEAELRKVIVRTERLAATSHRGGMLAERSLAERLEAADLATYIGATKAAKAVGHGEVIEFWKSAPYFFSFLEDYKLRGALSEADTDPDLALQLGAALQSAYGMVLPIGAAKGHAPVALANARLRGFQAQFLDSDPWQLLWIPPSLAYYSLAGPFARPGLAGLTKRLLFSAWRMVPRSICTVIGHNVISRALTPAGVPPETVDYARLRLPSPLLRFQRDADKRLTGIPLFSLIYPSWTLAHRVDPLVLGRAYLRAHGRLPDLGEMRSLAAERVRELLAQAGLHSERSGAADERWYGMGAALLDKHFERSLFDRWRENGDLSYVWQGEDVAGDDSPGTHWQQHVREFEALSESGQLGRMPTDLSELLAELAIAGPSTAALRALLRTAGKLSKEDQVFAMNQACAVGWSLRNLMNLPESIAIVRRGSDTDPYWRRVLEYCAEGGLQSVLDEYAHFLTEGLSVTNKPFEEQVAEVGERIRKTVGARPASIGVEEFSFEHGAPEPRLERMATRFAVPLTEIRATDTGTTNGEGSVQSRVETVGDAFNSPFWPFVLASTSIGQEGLDFHPYCHAVVHWNLPNNPVDLEQREGRVHRYKGHAIRKNVATIWGAEALRGDSLDVWSDMFSRAREARASGTSDLVPYWICPLEGGASIERHVPGMPLSREASRIIDLRRTLAVYRMVFGQPRQEDLIEYLISLGEKEVDALSEILQINLSPPRTE